MGFEFAINFACRQIT